jgi:ABC-type xylose transport system permease subunit
MRSALLRARMPLVLALLFAAATVLTDGVFARPENLINVARQISFEAPPAVPD